jgi:hypothetical protein
VVYIEYRHCGDTTPTELRCASISPAVTFEGKADLYIKSGLFWIEVFGVKLRAWI